MITSFLNSRGSKKDNTWIKEDLLCKIIFEK